MTDSLAFRGPDAQRIWAAGPVGFGHALMCVTNDTDHEVQPASLDGRAFEEKIWIVADARVDDRSEIIRKLRAAGREIAVRVPDHELILHAYHVWGSACVDHLVGDFAFAIWDGMQRRLFCARDHFGVKPFYYVQIGKAFIFSNTLDCLRLHPTVSSGLNDLAIADFLLFDFNQDPTTTSFTDIRRLSPAHVLICERGDVSTNRYWTLSVTEPIYKRGQDCVEHFRELMDAAVADRLRTESVALLMSGGLDSATVAASAQGILTRQGSTSGLCAYTEVFDSLIPHKERHYAGMVATALNIPIKFHVSDDFPLFGDANPSSDLPEPAHTVWPNSNPIQFRQIARRSRVALTGMGADPMFSSLLSVHFRQLLQRGYFGRALADAVHYLVTEGRLSRLYVRTRYRRWFPSRSDGPFYPIWLNKDLEKQLGLRERWERFNRVTSLATAVRPVAHAAVVASIWPIMFEGYDSGATHIPLEVRHPFFVLRLATFLLSLPALPWCSDKQLLREAARGVLPNAVRLRRKSPLITDPLISLLRKPESEWVDHFAPVSALERYVLRNRVPKVFNEGESWTAWIHLRPLSLNFWLRRTFGSVIRN